MTQIIETRALSSQEIMDLDQNLLESLQDNPRPILHLYSWPTPTLSYGCLVNPASFLDLEAALRLGLTVVKRPTGGGLIFHLTDLAFSFLLPSQNPSFSVKTNENYLFVNGLVAKALKNFTSSSPSFLQEDCPTNIRFCMAKATQYDLLMDGGKLVGAAQRRTRFGLLHQGSISIAPPPYEVIDEVLLDKPLADEMRKTSRFLIEKAPNSHELEAFRQKIEGTLRQVFAI